MKTPVKILIVAALLTSVIVVVAIKNNKPPAAFGATNESSSIPAAAGKTTKAKLSREAKLPKLLDLGAGKCIPCKMMAPILEDLKKEFTGKLVVEFIDVWQNPDVGKQYGIDVIPTQIFYDMSGKELFRHTGFFAKDDILGKWKELGVDLGEHK